MQILRNHLDQIARYAIKCVHPRSLLQEAYTVTDKHLLLTVDTNRQIAYDLHAYTTVLLCAIGKAAEPMAHTLWNDLNTYIDEGIVITKERSQAEIGDFSRYEGGHPIPNTASTRNGAAVLSLLQKTTPETLLINCISGGASALCCAPFQSDALSITLDDMQQVSNVLLSCNATIAEINCIRKHLSRIKGGRYLEHAAPATSITFLISDVRFDDMSTIASGLTAPDRSTYQDALYILKKYDIWNDIPQTVKTLLRQGGDGLLPETPAAETPIFHLNQNSIIGNTMRAAQAAQQRAAALGYTASIITDCLFGEAREMAAAIAAIVAYHMRYSYKQGKPLCLIFGGETTVTIRGTGMGGRNQELAAAFLKLLLDDPFFSTQSIPLALLSVATDGNDGPTDAAGGFADYAAARKAQKSRAALDAALANNNSYALHTTLQSIYKIGYTHANVCDLQCVLIGTRAQ